MTVHDNAVRRRYACAIPAAITMAADEAARGLAKQAVRRHQARGGLFSQMVQTGSSAQTRGPRRGVSPMRWLRALAERPAPKAA